ncbi:unnamed protein product, partial [Onchocerca flexuosa]|uniref:Metalloendopeptidase n=1 Tax=Onchocerca flexuosa TaxID=387005 RepID=A0A183H1G3_9BILA
DEPEKTEPTDYKFWCCQCNRNVIDDVTRINNNSALSNGDVVTRQPLPSNEINYVHNNLNFSNHVSETKTDFYERKHELDSDNEMETNMKRLKEESTNITSTILDNLISESRKMKSEEELTKCEQKEIKKLPNQQDSTGNEYNMKDIAISDANEGNFWKSIPINEETTNRNELYGKWTGDNYKEQAVHGNFDDSAIYDDKEESKETSDASDTSSISGQISESESFVEDSSQIKEPEIKPNDIEFLEDVDVAIDSEQDIGKSSKPTNNLTSFTHRKVSLNTIESDSLSMICIPDVDLVIKEEFEHKNVSKSEHDIDTVRQANKMYANDVSSSSSSDSEEASDTIMPSSSSGKIISIIEESEKIVVSTKKYKNNTEDEDALEDIEIYQRKTILITMKQVIIFPQLFIYFFVQSVEHYRTQKASRHTLDHIKQLITLNTKRQIGSLGDKAFADPIVLQQRDPEAKRHHNELSVNDPDEYYQGDVDLSEKQAELLSEHLKNEIVLKEKDDAIIRRKKSVGREPLYVRWNRKRPISYDFAESIPLRTREKIRAAIAMWEERTCIRFQENGPNVNRIEFFDGGGCSSFVGRTGGTQGISISTPGCDVIGIISHEIGHTLGIFHEQARLDQKNHIFINYNNIPFSRWNNFSPLSEYEADMFNLPYDTGSVMHYGPYGFAKDPYVPTITTRDKFQQYTIGQREGPSFLDYAAINAAYRCTEQCTDMHCNHNGYPNPNNCAKCLCPDGFAGSTCEFVQYTSCGALIKSGAIFLKSQAKFIVGTITPPSDRNSLK